MRIAENWEGKRGAPTLTHQELFVQGCHDKKLGLCFSSVFPLLFSLDESVAIQLLAIYVVSHFIKCQTTLLGLIKNGREKGNLDS